MIDFGDDEYDAQRTADALVLGVARTVAAEAQQLLLVAHWADLHDPDSIPARHDATGRVLPGTERAKDYGADGTPPVAEFAVPELAPLLGITEMSAAHLLRDALDLRHRHPVLWQALAYAAGADGLDRDPAEASGLPRVWQARKVAHATHAAGLTLAQARWVDAETAPHLGSMSWTRFEALVQARIIEVDPAAAEARRQAAARRRYLTSSQTNEHGLKTVIAQATAGDAIAFLAACDRIAQCLALEGDTDPLPVRRSKAYGIIANPAATLALFLRHAQAGPTDDPRPEDPEGRDPAPGRPASELELFDQRPVDPREPTAPAGCLGHPGGGRCAGCSPTDSGPRPRGDAGGSLLRHLAHRDDQLALDTVDANTGSRIPSSSSPDVPPGRSPDGGGPSPDDPGPAPPDPGLLRTGDLHPADDDSDDPARTAGGPPCPACGAGTIGTRRRVSNEELAALLEAKLLPSRLQPKGVLYLHVAADAYLRDEDGVARFENGPHPVTHDELTEILGHANVHVHPVIDLERQASVDRYEIPAALREAVKLAHPFSVFPYSPTSSRGASVDLDHPTPYRHPVPGRPLEDEDRGQTSLDNLAPLGRSSHRAKTFGRGWTHRKAGDAHWWRTPSGYVFRVDAHGTRPLGRFTATAFHDLVRAADQPLDQVLEDVLGQLRTARARG